MSTELVHVILQQLTALSSPGVPSAAWDAKIVTRTWQDFENLALRMPSGTLSMKRYRVRHAHTIQ